MTKLISLLLAALLLAACSAAPENAAGDPGQETQTAAEPDVAETAETDPPEYVSPGKDYGGETFTTAAIDYYAQGGGNWVAQDYCEAYTNETTGEILNDAIYERNAKVSEELNVNMVPYGLTSYGSAGTEFRQALLSGETSVDICLMNGNGLVTMLSSGLLRNLYDFSGIDFSHSWWDQSAVEEFTIMGSLFAVTGDISLGISLSPITYFFGKQMLGDHQLEDPYTLVREGRWTADKSIEMASAVAQDVNGNGQIDWEEDHFGIALESLSMVYAIHASGVSLTNKDEEGVPYIDVDQERASAVTEKFQPFFNNKNVTLFADKIGGYSNTFRELFLPSLMENRLLFFSNQLLVALNLREMDSDFGILPYPKLDENQADYLCPVSYWWATFLIIPKANSRPELTADMAEAMGYFSQKLITPAYMEKSIQGKSLRDEDSLDMLDLILSHRVYELAAIYDWGGINSMYQTLASNETMSFASQFKSKQKVAQKNLDKTIDEIRESFGN